jgi:hypothetical protein
MGCSLRVVGCLPRNIAESTKKLGASTSSPRAFPFFSSPGLLAFFWQLLLQGISKILPGFAYFTLAKNEQIQRT